MQNQFHILDASQCSSVKNEWINSSLNGRGSSTGDGGGFLLLAVGLPLQLTMFWWVYQPSWNTLGLGWWWMTWKWLHRERAVWCPHSIQSPSHCYIKIILRDAYGILPSSEFLFESWCSKLSGLVWRVTCICYSSWIGLCTSSLLQFSGHIFLPRLPLFMGTEMYGLKHT